MPGERDYPVLFGTTRADWAPIDLRFELLGPPRPVDGGERISAVEVLAPERAVAFLRRQGRAWEADLYLLATRRRRAERVGAG